MSGGSDFENKYGSRRWPGIVDCDISRPSGIDRARSAGKRLGVREFTLAAPMRYAWLASGFIHIVASSPLCLISDCYRTRASALYGVAVIRCLEGGRLVLSLYRRRSSRFSGMIPESDIWRAAQLMLKRKALEESAARADELALAGDADGATTWRRIVAAVTELANKVPLARSTERPGFSK